MRFKPTDLRAKLDEAIRVLSREEQAESNNPSLNVALQGFKGIWLSQPCRTYVTGLGKIALMMPAEEDLHRKGVIKSNWREFCEYGDYLAVRAVRKDYDKDELLLALSNMQAFCRVIEENVEEIEHAFSRQS